MKAIRRLLGTVELGLRTINLDAALFRAEHTLCTPEQRRTAQSACGNSADPDQAVFNAG
jgi:hypothetical protein